MAGRLNLIVMVVAALAAIVMSTSAYAGDVVLPNTDFHVKVMSLKEMRDSRVVKQEYDYSCGSAALATLLTFSYDIPTTEHQTFDDMWNVGDQSHIRQHGFSLLDMQKYLANRGLHGVGYKLPLSNLRRMHLPAIALVNINGYNHFIVVRGWKNNAAIVADPRLGLRRIPAEDFTQMWNGIIFVLQDNQELGHSRFNDPNDLKLITRSSDTSGMAYGRQNVADYLMNIPTFNLY
jgi:predicted double-glycine peptidase